MTFHQQQTTVLYGTVAYAFKDGIFSWLWIGSEVYTYRYCWPKPNESWNFLCLVSLRAMFFVKFCPLFSDHRLQRTERGSRRFRGSRQWTADCHVSEKSANVQANNICPKIRFFVCLYSNLLFFKISYSAHSDKMLVLWIVFLDHLILNCMELLTSFKSYKEV